MRRLPGTSPAARAGLWTHYSFPVVLAAAGLAYAVNLLRTDAGGHDSRTRRLVRFAAANAVILLLYLPWLPTAVNRVRNWPKGGD